MQQVFCNTTQFSPSTTAANYIEVSNSGIGYATPWNSSSIARSMKMAQIGFFANLHVWLATAPGVGKTWTFVVQKNGVDTTLTGTISDAGISMADNTHSFTVVEGDRVHLKVTPSGTPTATGIFQWSISFTGTTKPSGASTADPNQFFILGGGRNFTKSTTIEEYMSICHEQDWRTNQFDAESIAPLSGTIRRLNIALLTTPGTGNGWTFKFYVNGVAIDSTFTITGSGLGGSATINVPFSAGDRLSLGVLPTGTPTAFTTMQWGLCIESAVAGESWIGGNIFDQTDSGSTEYQQLMSPYDVTNTATEGNVQAKCGAIPFVLKKFYVQQFSAVSGGSYDYTVRKNGADTSLKAIVSSGNSIGSDTSNSVSFASGDTVDLEITPISTPSTTSSYDFGVVQYIAPKSPTLTESLSLTDSVLLQKIKSTILTETLTLTDTLLKLANKILTEVLNLTATFSTPSTSGTFRVVSGSYTGNATDNRAITGLGFSPKFVMIKAITSGANDDPVAGWTDMGADNSCVLDPATAVASNLIQSFDADGFTIGNASQVNTNTTVYYWIAFGGDATSMFTGSYTGDGLDNRSITGVGFQPNVVFVKRSTGVTPFFRFSSMSGDNSSPFSNAGGTVANRIQAMESDGFQIGSNASVNASGGTFYYFCIKFPTGQGIAGSYTGNGSDNRAITTPSFLPSFVMIKSDTTNYPVFRATIHSGDDTSQIGDSLANAADMIQSLDAVGFTVGTDAKVNTNAVPYFYIAMRDGGASQTKTLTETATFTDTVLRIPGKILAETLTFTDTVLKQGGKILTELIQWLDPEVEALRVSIQQFTETLTLTDTVIKMGKKVLTETLTLTDTVLKQAGKIYTETITFLDTVLKQAGKMLIESLSVRDNDFTITKVTQKILTDTITFTDVFSRIWTSFKTFTETLTLTDTVLKRGGKILTETITFTDTMLRGFLKTLTETLTLTATMLRQVGRTFSETLTLTDTVIKTTFKAIILTELLTLTDFIIKSFVNFVRKIPFISANRSEKSQRGKRSDTGMHKGQIRDDDDSGMTGRKF